MIIGQNYDGSGNLVNALQLFGNASKTLGGTSWVNASDKRLKEDVKPYERGLKEILQINPVYYTYSNEIAIF